MHAPLRFILLQAHLLEKQLKLLISNNFSPVRNGKKLLTASEVARLLLLRAKVEATMV